MIVKIEIELPIIGTYYEDTKRGDPSDEVRPLPFPFPMITHQLNLISLDIETGTAIYEVQMDDSQLTPGVIEDINAFFDKSPEDKRTQIAALQTKEFTFEDPKTKLMVTRTVNVGRTTGTFQKKREVPD